MTAVFFSQGLPLTRALGELAQRLQSEAQVQRQHGLSRLRHTDFPEGRAARAARAGRGHPALRSGSVSVGGGEPAQDRYGRVGHRSSLGGVSAGQPQRTSPNHRGLQG